MFKKIVKTINDLLFIILLIALAISFYSWMQINVLKKSYASFMGYSIFEVVTGSMSGTIEVNDYIIVKNQNNYNLKDVITFKDGNSIVTHRIVEIKGDSYITRGDVNTLNDIEITYDKIIGRVVFVIPNGSIWKKVFTDYKVLGLVLITVVLFSIYFSLEEKENKKSTLDVKKSKKKLKKKEKPIEEVEDIDIPIEKEEQIEEIKEEINEEVVPEPTPIQETKKKENSKNKNYKPYYKTAKYRQRQKQKKQNNK